MTAVTLSTLAHRSMVIEDGPVSPGGRPGAAGAGRCVSVVPGGGAKASETRPARDPDAAARATSAPCAKRLDALEHQARGLLNLIALVSRCLDDGTEAERAAWRAQVAEASERLEMLYRAGLRRTFMSERAAPSGGTGTTGALAVRCDREATTPGGGVP